MPTGSSSGNAAPTGTPAGTVNVVMKHINFNPNTVYAMVGETVTWTNRDDAPHNVTYVVRATVRVIGDLHRRQSFTLRLTKPGIIHYLCTIHPGMDGSIVVSR